MLSWRHQRYKILNLFDQKLDADKILEKVKFFVLPVTGSSSNILFVLIIDSIPPQLIPNSTHNSKKHVQMIIKTWNIIVIELFEPDVNCQKHVESDLKIVSFWISLKLSAHKRFTYALTRGFARSGKISAAGKCAWKWRVKIKLIISISIKLFLIQLETTSIISSNIKPLRNV